MKKKGISEPLAVYAATSPHDPLEEATQIAQSILDEAGIKAVEIVDEELEDEYCTWVNRIFYIKRPVQEVVDLTLKLAEKEVKKGCLSIDNAVVMFLPVG